MQATLYLRLIVVLSCFNFQSNNSFKGFVTINIFLLSGSSIKSYFISLFGSDGLKIAQNKQFQHIIMQKLLSGSPAFFQPDDVYKAAQVTGCHNCACQRTKSAQISGVDDYFLFLNRKEKHKNLQYVKEHFDYFSSKNIKNLH